MRVIPETYTVEGADTYACSRRQHGLQKVPMQFGLPGPPAHIESPRATTEQERPRDNRCLVAAGVMGQGKNQAASCQWSLGVGPSHSSDEAREGPYGRVGGAKGKAEQGTRRRER